MIIDLDRPRRDLILISEQSLLNEVINNRAGSALYITVFSIIVLAELTSILVLYAESANPDANITTAGDAVWWATAIGFRPPPWGVSSAWWSCSAALP